MIPKTKWRSQLLLQRRSLSEARRNEASLALRENLLERGSVLSFCSFQSEIDTSLLNAALASQGRLFLPRVEGTSLIAYHVTDPEKQLIRSSLGVLEPDPALCSPISFSQLERILVPGLGFDRRFFRLGYGKGHYDRLLASTDLPSIGIGFKEQLIEECLPTDTWDVPVHELYLF